MRKKIGNIEVEMHEGVNNGQVFLVYLSIRSSTMKTLNIMPDDARDLIHGLEWALSYGNAERKSVDGKEVQS